MLTHRVGASSRAEGANMTAYLAVCAQLPKQAHYAEKDKGLAEPANATLSLSPAMAQWRGTTGVAL